MTMQEQLNQYYKDVGIAPVSWSSDPDKMFKAFKCENKCACRAACRGGNEEIVFEPRIDGVTVSQEYQDGKYHCEIPRIVVLSLSKPQPEGVPDTKPAAKPKTPLGPHWRETLAMVRSLLHPFIAEKLPGATRYWEDESRKKIEKFFVHVRTAKCCSNANGMRAEPPEVYANCGGYLGKELSILKPDVIVTQGNQAHWMAKEHAFGETKKADGLGLDHPIAYIVNLKYDNRSVYWLRSYFPTYWGYYRRHAGKKIDCESNVVGAKRENFVRYGEAIQEFIKDR